VILVPLVENPAGTLWIGIERLSEVEPVNKRLATLGVPIAALLPDADCDVPVREVDWRDLYPRIVPRNGPEPGILVERRRSRRGTRSSKWCMSVPAHTAGRSSGP
jgi:hypothetical protein